MHLPPILILQIYYVSDQHKLHSVLNRAPCMHLTVNWDSLLHTQFGSTGNTHLYTFFIFLFSTLPSRTAATTQFHPDAQPPPPPPLLPGWPPCTGPSRTTTHRLRVFSHHHFTHLTVGCPEQPPHTSYQCYLRQHVYCSLTSLGHHGDHIFVAGPRRLYSHLAHPILHTGR